MSNMKLVQYRSPYHYKEVGHNTKDNSYYEHERLIGGPKNTRDISHEDAYRHVHEREAPYGHTKTINEKHAAKYLKEHELPYWDKK